MTKPVKPATTTQDAFDKAFITIITELQGMGMCKNVAALEERLNIPKRTLYQVLKGGRSLPKIHRHKLQSFFADNYNVNARRFINATVPIFQNNELPVADPLAQNPDVTQWTVGDAQELRRLRLEMAAKKDEIKELRQQVKTLLEIIGKQAGNPATTPAKTGGKNR